jgi:hypothetical protein
MKLMTAIPVYNRKQFLEITAKSLGNKMDNKITWSLLILLVLNSGLVAHIGFDGENASNGNMDFRQILRHCQILTKK